MIPQPGSEEANREALVRVLAGESRNALARVELAASELARFEASPSLHERVATIREAVAEIDSLLAKIDLMAENPAHRYAESCDLVEVVGAVCQRLGSSLRARGVSLEWAGHEPGLFVPVPQVVLEGLIFGFLRVALASGEARQAGQAGQAGMCVEVMRREASTWVVLSASHGGDRPRAFRLDRESQIELEVALAEWGGRLLSSEDDLASGFGFGFPDGSSDG